MGSQTEKTNNYIIIGTQVRIRKYIPKNVFDLRASSGLCLNIDRIIGISRRLLVLLVISCRQLLQVSRHGCQDNGGSLKTSFPACCQDMTFSIFNYFVGE